MTLSTPFTRHAGIEVPLICGPMYPCSNPELVAAVSEAGGLGIIQAMTLAKFADAIASGGGEVTGRSLYDYFATTRESIWPEEMSFWADGFRITRLSQLISVAFVVGLG